MTGEQGELERWAERVGRIAGKEAEGASLHPDAFTQAEKTRLQLEQLNEQVKSFRQDRAGRAIYGVFTSALVSLWMVVVLALLIMSGFHVSILGHAFELPDTVLIALVAGTTANVIGLFWTILKYLFPDGSRGRPSKLDSSGSAGS